MLFKKQHISSFAPPSPAAKEISEAQSTTSSFLSYALERAKVCNIPNETVGIFVADARKLFSPVLMPSDMMAVPVIVYRTGRYLRFYNHQLQLCGAIRIADDGFSGDVYGKAIQSSSISGWQKNPFLGFFNYKEIEKNLKNKFRGISVLVTE